MSDEEIVCYCSDVTRRQIIDALHDGAETMEDIRRMTGACTLGKCRELSPRKKCCSPIIVKIIEEYKASR
ncbi:MAG TPA: (2Fe-2S)-binding protein [Synergistaceae bacterium]|jgi:NAD(P)H-nitrite reductase large subunit|nr:(2Fe-2S)-binding protein [Synergistaceae bacterium]